MIFGTADSFTIFEWLFLDASNELFIVAKIFRFKVWFCLHLVCLLFIELRGNTNPLTFSVNHKCRLTMPALQKKYNSTSILVELSTEWQYWLTSLGSLKVLLMWNLLKLKLFRKLLSWTSQSCMAANSRCESCYFSLSLTTADGLFPFCSLHSLFFRWTFAFWQ